MRAVGEMPEWPNGTDSKSVVLATVPRVQIPISPPLQKNLCKSIGCKGPKAAICSSSLQQFIAVLQRPNRCFFSYVFF
jgi:hypothetical protein